MLIFVYVQNSGSSVPVISFFFKITKTELIPEKFYQKHAVMLWILKVSKQKVAQWVKASY